MSLIGFKAKNHPQQTKEKWRNDNVDDRALTKADFERLLGKYSLTLDSACSEANKKCEKYFTESDNGLLKSWKGERVYCNPPYSDIRPWVEKAWSERMSEVVVMLLPANRTEQKWWIDLVEPFRDRPGSPLRIEFLQGRLRFLKPGQSEIGPNERPPFGCCLAIWQWSQASLCLPPGSMEAP